MHSEKSKNSIHIEKKGSDFFYNLFIFLHCFHAESCRLLYGQFFPYFYVIYKYSKFILNRIFGRVCMFKAFLIDQKLNLMALVTIKSAKIDFRLYHKSQRKGKCD